MARIKETLSYFIIAHQINFQLNRYNTCPTVCRLGPSLSPAMTSFVRCKNEWKDRTQTGIGGFRTCRSVGRADHDGTSRIGSGAHPRTGGSVPQRRNVQHNREQAGFHLGSPLSCITVRFTIGEDALSGQHFKSVRYSLHQQRQKS